MLNWLDSSSVSDLWQRGKERREKTARLMRIYGHDWASILDAEMKQRFEDQRTYQRMRLHADTSFNPLRWAVDRVAAIYSRPVIRTPKQADPNLLIPYTSEGELDLALDQAARLTYLCRESFVRPLTVERDGQARITIEVLTPDRVEVIPDPRDPLKIKAIMYLLSGDIPRYMVWTDELQIELNDAFEWVPSEENPQGINIYGEIPWVAMHAKYPVCGFWHHIESEMLERATVEAGIAMTSLRYSMKMQSFKQLASTGAIDRKATRFVADPGQVLVTPGGQIQLLDWQINLSQIMDVILQQVGTVLSQIGIRPEALKGTLDASSGYALTIKMHELEREWEAQRRLNTVSERQLWRKARKVYEVDQGRRSMASWSFSDLPDESYDIEWPEIGPARDPKEVADLALSYKNTGWSEQHIFAEVYGKDEGWIEENFAQREEERARFGELSLPPDDDPYDIYEEDTPAPTNDGEVDA